MKKLLTTIAFVALVAGCGDSNAPASGSTWRNVYLTTHRHDGHSFVVAMGMEGGPSVIHHPACECLTTKAASNP